MKYHVITVTAKNANLRNLISSIFDILKKKKTIKERTSIHRERCNGIYISSNKNYIVL